MLVIGERHEWGMRGGLQKGPVPGAGGNSLTQRRIKVMTKAVRLLEGGLSCCFRKIAFFMKSEHEIGNFNVKCLITCVKLLNGETVSN